MPRQRPRSIAGRIDDARDFIHNTLGNATILAGFEGASQPRTVFEQAAALLDDVIALQNKCSAERGQKKTAAADYTETLKGARKKYKLHLARARVAFRKDPGAVEALGLAGPRARAHAAMMGQCLQFYDNVLVDDDRKERMASVGINETALTTAHAAFHAVDDADRNHQRETDEARTAKKQRDVKLEALNEWLVVHRELARTIFGDDPEVREQLGL